MKAVDVEAASRLLSGVAYDAQLWIASNEDPQAVLRKAIDAFRVMAEGRLAQRS